MDGSRVRSIPEPQITLDIAVDLRRTVREVLPAVSGLVDFCEHDIEDVLHPAVGHGHGKAVLQITGGQEDEGICTVGDLRQGEGAFGVGTQLTEQFHAAHQPHAGIFHRRTVRLGQDAPLYAPRGGVREQEGRPQEGDEDRQEPLHAYFLSSTKVG